MGEAWLQAARAIYAEVPVTVAGGTNITQTTIQTIGVKEGCPLSPALFGRYIYMHWSLNWLRRCGRAAHNLTWQNSRRAK